jgi:hypothetical protein
VIDPLPALRAAVAELLSAQGERDLAALVAGAGLELAGPPERWSMGSREVIASRLSLMVAPLTFAALSAQPAKLSLLRDTFARAVRTPETELADLTLVLRLPGIERGWHTAYRDAPPPPIERPDPEAVQGGAAALLDVLGDGRAAAALRRARLEAADVPSAGPAALIRYVICLDPADRAAADRDPDLAERLRRAVRDAATRAAFAVAGVDLATSLPSPAARPPNARALLDIHESRLIAALAARGAVALPVTRTEERVEIALITGGELRRVELVAGSSAADPAWRAGTLRSIEVSIAHLEDPESAHAVAALLCDGVEI